MEQLQSKKDKLSEINEQIVTLINDSLELEGFISEAENLQDDSYSGNYPNLFRPTCKHQKVAVIQLLKQLWTNI